MECGSVALRKSRRTKKINYAVTIASVFSSVGNSAGSSSNNRCSNAASSLKSGPSPDLFTQNKEKKAGVSLLFSAFYANSRHDVSSSGLPQLPVKTSLLFDYDALLPCFLSLFFP